MTATAVFFTGVIACAYFAVGVPFPGNDSKAADRLPTLEELGLFVDAKELNFGEAWERKDYTWQFTVQNRSDRALRIESFTTSCNCLAVKPDSLSLLPGQKATLQLSIDLRASASNKCDAAGIFDYQTAVTAFIADETGPLQHRSKWVVAGRVRSVLKTESRGMDLGTHSHRGQPDVLGKLRVESVLPLGYILADTKASWARLEIQSVPGKADQFDLVVRRRDLLKLGSHKLEIGLTPVRPTREKLGDKVIEAMVEIVRDVQSLPSGLFFGVKDPGGVGEQVVRLHSLTESPFTIASYRVEGAEAQIRPMADNSGPAFRITMRTAQTGQQQGRCVFVVRHQDGEEYDVVVPISYYGTATVSP